MNSQRNNESAPVPRREIQLFYDINLALLKIPYIVYADKRLKMEIYSPCVCYNNLISYPLNSNLPLVTK